MASEAVREAIRRIRDEDYSTVGRDVEGAQARLWTLLRADALTLARALEAHEKVAEAILGGAEVPVQLQWLRAWVTRLAAGDADENYLAVNLHRVADALEALDAD